MRRAQGMVSSYRSTAPEGCDPQNSWVAIAGTVISTGVSVYGANKSKKDAQKAQQGAMSNANGYLNDLQKGKYGSLDDIFGSELDPEAFAYHPVDLTQSQLDTIQGNIQATPSAVQLTGMVNPEIWKNDLSRIRSLMPGFDNARDTYVGNTQKLLQGELPFQDVEDIVSNRSSTAAMLGTPGGSRNATLRDLGLSRLDAMNQGASMFQQFTQIAEGISPVQSQMRPQQMFFTPSERAQLDIEQASLMQQASASMAIAEAMPNPGLNAITNARIGLNMASFGQQSQPQGGTNWGQIAGAISGVAGAYANRSQTPTTSQMANVSGAYGGSMSGGGAPISQRPSYYGSFNSGSGPSGYVAPTQNNLSSSNFGYGSGYSGPPSTGQAPYQANYNMPNSLYGNGRMTQPWQDYSYNHSNALFGGYY